MPFLTSIMKGNVKNRQQEPYEIDEPTFQILTSQQYDDIFIHRQYTEFVSKELLTIPIPAILIIIIFFTIRSNWVIVSAFLLLRFIIGLYLYFIHIRALTPLKFESSSYQFNIRKRMRSLTTLFTLLLVSLVLQSPQNQIISAIMPLATILHIGFLIIPIELHDNWLKNLYERHERTLKMSAKYQKLKYN